jgi:hypothetical protein
MILKPDIFNTLDCFKFSHRLLTKGCEFHIISRLIGYFHFILAVTTKIPQINLLYAKKSVEGLSEMSLLLDLAGVLFEFLFCYKTSMPVHTWMGSVFNYITTFIVILLFWFYSEGKASGYENFKRIVFCLANFILIFVCAADGKLINLNIPDYFWVAMLNFRIPMITTSKLSQIIKIFKTGKVKAVSDTRYLLTIIKNSSKIFMIILESSSLSLIFCKVYTVAFNLFIYAQIKIYSAMDKNADKNTEEEPAKDKSEEE